jgi:hypothetical protein
MFDDTGGFENRGGVTPQSVRYSLVDVVASLMKVSREEFVQAASHVTWDGKWVDFPLEMGISPGIFGGFSYEK